MGKKEIVFNFLSQMFFIFGTTIVGLSIVSLLIGEKVQYVSTLFVMGYVGLTFETIFQLLLSSFFIVSINKLIFSNLIKSFSSRTSRTLFLLVSILVIVIIFTHLFKWLPRDVLNLWLIFLFILVLVSIIAVWVTYKIEKKDDKNMEHALKNFQNKLIDKK